MGPSTGHQKRIDNFARPDANVVCAKIARVVNRSIRNMVNAEFDKFRERAIYELSPVEIHFIDQFEAEQKRLKEKSK